jgi:hypothetical protein
MPALETRPLEHHGFGRPPLDERSLLELAWLRDLDEQTERELVELYELDQQRPGKGRRADPRSTLRYRVNRARAVAAALGVLPWAAWPDGRLPRGWWSSSAFEAAITRWVGEALTLDSPARGFLASYPRAADLLRRT